MIYMVEYHPKFEIIKFQDCCTIEGTSALKGTNHRVLFQNANGTINMGVWFNDPDIELDEIFWYSILTREMFYSFEQTEGIISVDKELNTYSCYVELLRTVEKLTYTLVLSPT